MSRKISARLQHALDTLRASPVAFSTSAQCFVMRANNAKKRGLTPILARLLPVPCGSTEPPRKRARRSRNDPEPDDRAWLHPRDAGSRLVSAAPACVACNDKEHGIAVDTQLKIYTKRGWTGLCAELGGARRVDPCVATLLDYFARHAHLRPVASQLPIYSAQMDVATALDLVATDDATLSEVHLLEVKASRRDTATNYERLRGRLARTTLRGAPLSYYSRHQVQLWTQRHMLAEMRVPVASASVVRVSPGVVHPYALNPWYEERSKRFVRAIATQTGQHRRTRRALREIGASPFNL